MRPWQLTRRGNETAPRTRGKDGRRPPSVRTRRRRLAPIAALLVAAVVGALLPAAPAQALPSGAGWSGSWNYYASDAFQVAGTLPGVEVTGFASDVGGNRALFGSIEDTADDGRCARVAMYSYDLSSYVVDEDSCGVGNWTTFSTGNFTGALLVALFRMIPNSTSYDKSSYIYIPTSTEDSGLRTVGTGASWSYYTPDAFQYSIVRSGVELTGYGAHQSFDLRSSLNTVENTGTGSGCASASVTAGSLSTSGSTCTSGGYDTFSRFDLDGNLSAEACYQPTGGIKRCVPLVVPEPW